MFDYLSNQANNAYLSDNLDGLLERTRLKIPVHVKELTVGEYFGITRGGLCMNIMVKRMKTPWLKSNNPVSHKNRQGSNGYRVQKKHNRFFKGCAF
ncbi:MAG: hypothetical protein DRH37_06915 [Deltaproteobacteria bacterium]|nr:MAG: hypothetical protein DRH37_06915 [Deltaproteobacteria bacterium]